MVAWCTFCVAVEDALDGKGERGVASGRPAAGGAACGRRGRRLGGGGEGEGGGAAFRAGGAQTAAAAGDQRLVHRLLNDLPGGWWGARGRRLARVPTAPPPSSLAGAPWDGVPPTRVRCVCRLPSSPAARPLRVRGRPVLLEHTRGCRRRLSIRLAGGERGIA